ncbi:ribonuclease H-like domain-containing protein [Tanacetum coccineum]|uniref:Ribonuclease H-like domain-containing protein n=1 Tax=Tanacetum coccineum TaxID=301880 RepID=A0ABQ5B8Y1_9ASTR
MEQGFLSQKGSEVGRGVKEKQVLMEDKSVEVGKLGNVTGEQVVKEKQSSLVDTTTPNVENTGLNSYPPLHTQGSTPTGNSPSKSSYANVTGEPSRKALNFCTLCTLGGNEIDVVVPVESIRAISDRFANTTYGFFLGKRVAYLVVANYVRNTWGKFGLVKSMLNSSTGLSPDLEFYNWYQSLVAADLGLIRWQQSGRSEGSRVSSQTLTSKHMDWFTAGLDVPTAKLFLIPTGKLMVPAGSSWFLLVVPAGRLFGSYCSIDGLNVMLESGPWFIRNHPLILKKWNPDVNLLKEDVRNIPVWVKLHGVPVTAFIEDCLSDIAIKLGIPLMLDSYTSDMCLQSWGRSSYAREMIDLRDDVELKDTIIVAMLKLNGGGVLHVYCSCLGVAKNLKKPSQASKGVPVGLKVGFKPAKEYRLVSKKPTANSSVDNDEEFGTNGGTSNLASNGANSSGSSFWNVETSSTNTTPIVEKIRKFEKLIIDGKVTLVDDDGKPLKMVDYPGDHDSEDEVESIDNDMARSMASERVGFGIQSLLEQWRDSYENGDYDEDPYNDDMYEGQDLPDKLQEICDNLDIRVRGNGGNQFGQYAGQIIGNQNGYNAVQNVGNQVVLNAVQNPSVQNVGNQNGFIIVPVIVNQNGNQTRNGNVVAAWAGDNGNGNNGDIDEIEEVNANNILMANLQQA